MSPLFFHHVTRNLIRLSLMAGLLLSAGGLVFADSFSQCSSSPCASGTTLSTLDFSTYTPNYQLSSFVTTDNTLTWSTGNGDTFYVGLSGDAGTYPGSAFPDGTGVLLSPGTGPFAILLSFLNPVSEFSVSMEDYFAGYGGSSLYSILVTAFNGATEIGHFTVDGSNDGTGVGYVAFASAQALGASQITSLTFDDVLNGNGNGSNDLVFGSVSYHNSDHVVVPEGGSALTDLLLALGICLAAISISSRRKAMTSW